MRLDYELCNKWTRAQLENFVIVTILLQSERVIGEPSLGHVYFNWKDLSHGKIAPTNIVLLDM